MRRVLHIALLSFALVIAGVALAQTTVDATPDEAGQMILHAERSYTAAEQVGVDATKLAELRQTLDSARKAFDKGKFNRARALARRVAGDADEARFQIESPKRISFSVSVDEDSGTQFRVNHGALEVHTKETSGSPLVLKEGEGVQVTDGTPKKVNLLAPPAPQLPEHAATVYDRVKLQWKTVEGAQQFGVDIAMDPAFHRRVMVGKTTNTWMALPLDLDNGTYWWRVTAIEANGTYGMASAPRRFDFAAGEAKPEVNVGNPVWGGN